MYNGYILFLTFHCIALGIGINGEGGGEEGSVQLCRENFCNNWYITGEKKEKKRKKRGKEVNSKCATRARY